MSSLRTKGPDHNTRYTATESAGQIRPLWEFQKNSGVSELASHLWRIINNAALVLFGYDRRMNGLKRRIISYLVVLGVALIVTSLGYQWGMATYEGRPRTFLDSLQFTVEMFTTTGFGGDSPWESPQMHAYIIITDLLGMALLVGALPVVATPLLKAVLATSAPEQVDEDLTDHVVICSDTTRLDVLIDELDSREVPYVIVESDRDRADELYETNDHTLSRLIRIRPTVCKRRNSLPHEHWSLISRTKWMRVSSSQPRRSIQMFR